jgi:Peptidase family M48
MSTLSNLAAICASLLLYSCASVDTRLPMPSAARLNQESARQETQAFAKYLTMRKRLDKISAPILAANAELCTKTRNDFGIITHTKKSYPKHVRGAAARRLAAGDTPSVLFIRDAGPAHDTKIEVGDVLLGDKDEPISARGKSLQDTNILKVRRSGEDMQIEIKANTHCDYAVTLKMSGAVNAYATGKSIIVTTAMMDFAQSDDELALVVGHELAHNTMRHVRKSIWNAVISGFATRATRPFESEADYVGLYYMARAGYNLSGVEDFWRRLGVRNPKSIVRAKTHPVTPKRLLAIRMAAQEIDTKQTAGKTLMPNYKPGKAPKHAK